MIGAKGLSNYGVEKTVRLVNRTGAATAIGTVAAIDSRQADGDSTSIEAGASNAVAIATANLFSDIVVAKSVLADNEEGEWILKSGDCQILVEATTDVAAGDVLIPFNAGTSLKNRSTSVIIPGCAIAHEAQAAAGPTLTRCRFDGEARFKTSAPAS